MFLLFRPLLLADLLTPWVQEDPGGRLDPEITVHCHQRITSTYLIVYYKNEGPVLLTLGPGAPSSPFSPFTPTPGSPCIKRQQH